MKYKDHVHLATGIALPVIALAKIYEAVIPPLPISLWILLGAQGMVDLDLLFVKNGRGHRTHSIAHRGDISLVLFSVFIGGSIFLHLKKSVLPYWGVLIINVIALLILGWNLHLLGDLFQGGVGVRKGHKIIRVGATSFTWDKYDSPGRGLVTSVLLLFVLGAGAWTFSHLLVAFLPKDAYRNIISCFIVYAFLVTRNGSVKMFGSWFILSVISVVFYCLDTPLFVNLLPEGSLLGKYVGQIKNFF